MYRRRECAPGRNPGHCLGDALGSKIVNVALIYLKRKTGTGEYRSTARAVDYENSPRRGNAPVPPSTRRRTSDAAAIWRRGCVVGAEHPPLPVPCRDVCRALGGLASLRGLHGHHPWRLLGHQQADLILFGESVSNA